MDGEADALALDDARIEDSVHCEGCGATFDVAEIVESPYEADDGGAYCAECAAKEWARVVEECSRLRAALEWYADPASWSCEWCGPPPLAHRDRGERARAALAPAAGEAAGDGDR